MNAGQIITGTTISFYFPAFEFIIKVHLYTQVAVHKRGTASD